MPPIVHPGGTGNESLKKESPVYGFGEYAGRGVHVWRSVDDIAGMIEPPVEVAYAQ